MKTECIIWLIKQYINSVFAVYALCGVHHIIKIMRVKPIGAHDTIHNYGWKSSLESFWKWMKIIGMAPSSEAEDISYFSSIHRWVTYLLVLFLHPSIFVHMLCNTESIVSTYTKGYYSSALHWNFLIDGFNYAAYIIGVYSVCYFKIIHRGHWKSLTDSFDLIETNFLLSAQDRRIGKKCSILVVTYLILSVIELYFT